MPTIAELSTFYDSLLAREAAAKAALFASDTAKARLVKAHGILADSELVTATIALTSAAPAFEQAQLQLQRAVYCVVTGDYRTAFFSLRLFLELTLAGISYSTDVIALKQWLNGGRDIVWAQIMDDDRGIFSHNFVKALSPDLWSTTNHYKGLARSLYRELSEYVHAAIPTHEDVGGLMQFRDDADSQWHDHLLTCHLVTLFSYIVRTSADLTVEQKAVIEPIYIRELGHIQAVRETFA